MFGRKKRLATTNKALMAGWQQIADDLCDQEQIGRVDVVRNGGSAQTLDASISGNTMYIGAGLLGCTPECQMYMIGHELGHRKRRHEIWFWACFAVGAIIAAYPCLLYAGDLLRMQKGLGASVVVAYAIVIGLSGCTAFLCSLPFLVMYRAFKQRTLILEWQADASAVAMLDKYRPNRGLAVVLNGMQEQRNSVLAQAIPQKQKDFFQRYYTRKLANLVKKKGVMVPWWTW